MSSDIHFETPENIVVRYRAAGLGTRFIAWFVDGILVWLVGILILLGAILVGVTADVFTRGLFTLEDDAEPARILLYFAAIAWVVFSLGSLIYFGASELLFRGQTIGKRLMEVRVVKADGFSLDPQAVFLRTVFRVVDHLPPVWIVPLVTKKSQRLGDLVAGTVVVSEARAALDDLREKLVVIPIAESRFRIDALALGRARPQDVKAVEQLLQRWSMLSDTQRQSLSARIVQPLAARLQLEPPSEDDRFTFLRDFLAAEYRRQYRKLG